MTILKPTRRLVAGLILGAALIAACISTVALAEGDRGRADIDFAAFLAETYPGAEVSEAPYCSIPEDNVYSADCEALVDGEPVFYVGRWNMSDDTFGQWQSDEEIADEADAAEAFTVWVAGTYGLEMVRDVYTPDCTLTSESEGSCHGTTLDGREIEADVVISNGDYEFTTEFVDFASFGTVLSDAATTCVTSGEIFDDDDYESDPVYEVLDDGHSVLMDGADVEEAFDCIATELGLPDRVKPELALLATTGGDPIVVYDGLTIVGGEDEDGDEGVLIYDETVAS